MTKEFKSWWKQGDYRFRFEADGDHFRIWVSDDRRPEEVELENRSTGLQWFLSFYLVFLVESQGDHEDAILLLDEPGLSLHPLAQRDLSAFFDGTTKTNQIIYTTHSPFLVDPDRLDRVRKVYVAADGSTESSPNLRQSGADPAHAGAAYAVYSALNLNVAESLLLGCRPIVVEGASDQHYLTMIKALLISAGKITPRRELVFPPAGGTKNAKDHRWNFDWPRRDASGRSAGWRSNGQQDGGRGAAASITVRRGRSYQRTNSLASKVQSWRI